jgi:sugar transferase (PEP-CTERM system associated)
MWRLLFRYLAFHKLGAVLVENGLVVTCVLADVGTANFVEPAPRYFAAWFFRAFVIAMTFQVCMHLRDVYDFRAKPSTPEFLFRLGQALTMACLTISAGAFAVRQLAPPPISLRQDLFRITVLLAVWHILLRTYFGIRANRKRILIMGTGQLARRVASEILRRPEIGMVVCGFAGDDPDLVGVSIVNPKVLGLGDDIHRLVEENKVDKVVVALQDRRGRLPIHKLLSLKTHGVEVEEATGLYEQLTGKIALENLKPSWMIFNDGFEVSRTMLLQKQLISFAVSLVLLLLSLPLLPLIALMIKLDSAGPVFHGQERVGHDGKTFTLWKFRSMRQDAELETGPVWAGPEDRRVTRVGKYLRRTRLDEIPQLFSVLKGEMSLVGPRPERPHFVKQLTEVIPFYNLRHSVKPGITGWAQINYRYGSSVEDAIEKLQYDLFYIKNMSWLLDTIIIFNTIKTVLVDKGS